MKKKKLSQKQYNVLIGLILLYGFAVNAIACIFLKSVFIELNPTYVIAGYLLSCTIGIMINHRAGSTFMRFAGYNMIVLPISMVLSITLADEHISSVAYTLIIVSGVTLMLIIIASIIPDVFKSLGKTLAVTLAGIIGAGMIIKLLEFELPAWWNWITATLFCAYIGYDWVKAQDNYYNAANAILSASKLYMDIINLFVRILKILTGRTKSA